MKKFKFSESDAEKMKSALKNLENDTLSELSAEYVTGGGCPWGCGCNWSKTKHSNSG